MNDGRSVPGMDRETAMARVGGDADLLKEIAALFLDESEKTIAEIRTAIAAGDASSIEHAAHGLKGAVANFGAAAVVEAAQRLEHLGRARQLQDALSAVETLEKALDALCAELRAL